MLALSACSKSPDTVLAERENYIPPAEYTESFKSLDGMAKSAKTFFGTDDTYVTPLGWSTYRGGAAPCGLTHTKLGEFYIEQRGASLVAFPDYSDDYWSLIDSCSPLQRPADWKTNPPRPLTSGADIKTNAIESGSSAPTELREHHGAPHEWDWDRSSLIILVVTGTLIISSIALGNKAQRDFAALSSGTQGMSAALNGKADYVFLRPDLRSLFGISFPQRRVVLGPAPNQLRTYGFDAITNAEVFLQTSENGQGNGARRLVAFTAGALLAGGPGAIVGGLSVGQRTQRFVHQVLVRCVIADPLNPAQDIVVFSAPGGGGLKADSPFIADAEKTARLIHAHLLNAMRVGA